MAATAITYKGTIEGKGGLVAFGTMSIDAASVAAAAQGIETAAILGAKVGDMVFVNARALPNRIAVVGAKVTAADEVSVYFNNLYDATTAVDAGAIVFDYMIVKLT